MTAILKVVALIIFEILKHYTPKMRRTTIDSNGSGEREKRLRDKIKNRWKNK
jgi:hypothetical protein